MRALALAVAVLGLALAAGATEQVPADVPADVAAFPTPNSEPLIKIVIAVGLISLAGWGLSYWTRRRRSSVDGSDVNIRVLASRGLGARHQVSLIEVSGRRLLVGTGGDSIATLADLSLEADFARTLNQEIPGKPEDGEDQLLEMIGKFEGLDA